jgi:hypothetical protein
VGFFLTGNEMPNIKIDNKEYVLGRLSEECKAQLISIQFVEQELARLQAQAAVLQTAKAAYLQGLKASLPLVGGSDTIKLSQAKSSGMTMQAMCCVPHDLFI